MKWEPPEPETVDPQDLWTILNDRTAAVSRPFWPPPEPTVLDELVADALEYFKLHKGFPATLAQRDLGRVVAYALAIRSWRRVSKRCKNARLRLMEHTDRPQREAWLEAHPIPEKHGSLRDNMPFRERAGERQRERERKEAALAKWREEHGK